MRPTPMHKQLMLVASGLLIGTLSFLAGGYVGATAAPRNSVGVLNRKTKDAYLCHGSTALMERT